MRPFCLSGALPWEHSRKAHDRTGEISAAIRLWNR